ncbi:hypothetical protein [Klebsiella pneumoniae]|uniref:hypothetical protein n=1 Tax=Klebsiella pneumoniae TaxID=573 RepID=UPI001D0DB7F8|nr:hypothetical protein [Klebsiella pneumoniae]
MLRRNRFSAGATDFAIATDNGAVIKSVSNLAKAINRNLQQIIAVRTWYANLVFGSNDDPRDVAPRVSGLANLSEYIDGMEKLIPDRVKQMMKMETGRLMAAFCRRKTRCY